MTTTILSFDEMVEVLRPERNDMSFLKMQAVALQKDLAISEELIAAQNKMIAKNIAVMAILASRIDPDDLAGIIRDYDEITRDE